MSQKSPFGLGTSQIDYYELWSRVRDWQNESKPRFYRPTQGELTSSKQKEREKAFRYFSPTACPSLAVSKEVIAEYEEANRRLASRNANSRWAWWDGVESMWVPLSLEDYEALVVKEPEAKENEFGIISP